MNKIYSKVNTDQLLHIIHRQDEFHTIEDGHRRDVVGEKEFIQLSALNMDKGHTFKPHKHIITGLARLPPFENIVHTILNEK